MRRALLLALVVARSASVRRDVRLIASWDGTELVARVVAAKKNSNSSSKTLAVLVNSWGLPSVEYAVPMRQLAEIGVTCVEYETRGFYGSGGEVDFAGSDDVADARAVIDWALEEALMMPSSAAAAAEVQVAMVGVSYGAGISLLAAAADGRIKTVVAYSGWGNLYDCLNWNESPSRAWADLLLGLGQATASLEPEIFRVWRDVRTHSNVTEARDWAASRAPALQLAALAENGPSLLFLSDMDDNLMHSQQILSLFEAVDVPRKALAFGRGTHAESEIPGLFGLDNATVLRPWTRAIDWITGREATARGGGGGISPVVEFALEAPPTATTNKTSLAFPTWPTDALRLATLRPAANGSLLVAVDEDDDDERAAFSATLAFGELSALRTGIPVLSDFIKPFAPTPATDLALVRRRSLLFLSDPLAADAGAPCGAPFLANLVVQPNQTHFQLYAYLYAVDPLTDLARLLSHVPYTAWNATPGDLLALPRLDFHVSCFDLPPSHRLALGFNMHSLLYTPATRDPTAALTLHFNLGLDSGPTELGITFASPESAF